MSGARAGELANAFLSRGDAKGWFDALYAEAEGAAERIPWADLIANPSLVSWLDDNRAQGEGRRAISQTNRGEPMRTKIVTPLLSLLAAVALIVAAPAQNKTPANQLTEAEKAAGWRLLFDGKTFNGWRGFHSDKVPEGWTIEDGCVKKVPAQGELGQAGGDLITVDQFDNFELSLEWKISKGGNSGVKYLVSESLPPTGKSAVSFEYQVLDDLNHPDAKAGVAGNRTAGSLYDLIPASKDKKLNPVGEFNFTRIVVKGNHVEHWLNGMKVLEFERGGEELKRHIAESKFKNTKGFGETAKGHILLQDHGDAVWYRNIKIRALKLK